MIPNLLGRFLVGQRPVIRAQVKDLTGTVPPGVATTVTFRVKDPAGVITTYLEAGPEVTEISDNLWEFKMPIITLDGEYWISADSDGVDAAQEGVIYVSRSSFG